MSWESWGSDDDGAMPDGYMTDERADELVAEALAEQAEKHAARVAELLAANNVDVARRRAAEAWRRMYEPAVRQQRALIIHQRSRIRDLRAMLETIIKADDVALGELRGLLHIEPPYAASELTERARALLLHDGGLEGEDITKTVNLREVDISREEFEMMKR